MTALILVLLPRWLRRRARRKRNGVRQGPVAALRGRRPRRRRARRDDGQRRATVTSDFSLGSGYVVRLQTLPSSSSASAVAKAKRAARAKGAKGVGVIDPQDFKLTPSSGKDFVIYSRPFSTRAEAEKALAKLRNGSRTRTWSRSAARSAG